MIVSVIEPTYDTRRLCEGTPYECVKALLPHCTEEELASLKTADAKRAQEQRRLNRAADLQAERGRRGLPPLVVLAVAEPDGEGGLDLVDRGYVAVPESFPIHDAYGDDGFGVDVSAPLNLEIAPPDVIDGNVTLDQDDDDQDDEDATALEPTDVIEAAAKAAVVEAHRVVVEG